ncbi:hypothetical protein HRI_003824300 [Hibiscus trionum]|uniref:MBD domain-containing protein n=1 Tax=Hibiscus trionum TaxID=183268 RepID=A0A9W7ISL5_HIBTR|nr:hypothetical protein HRI_003824300 [Hibiscus trionum]
MADEDSSRPIPDRWMFVVKKKKDGSSLSYYTCPESGQKYYSYEDLMRYVNYAKVAKLSIYADDFCPRKPPRRSKKRASTPPPSENNSDSDDPPFEPTPLTEFDWLNELSLTEFDKQSPFFNMDLENPTSNEGSSSNMGKAKKHMK